MRLSDGCGGFGSGTLNMLLLLLLLLGDDFVDGVGGRMTFGDGGLDGLENLRPRLLLHLGPLDVDDLRLRLLTLQHELIAR